MFGLLVFLPCVLVCAETLTPAQIGNAFFSAVDADGDGQISLQDVIVAYFKRYDMNGDNVTSETEFNAHITENWPAWSKTEASTSYKVFNSFSGDKLTVKEFLLPFLLADSNRDKAVTREEFSSFWVPKYNWYSFSFFG